jgi:hypothetical protein
MVTAKISTTTSVEFYQLAKEHRIKFSEALRVGISLILAEKGVKEYDNNLNLVRKLDLTRQKLEEVSRKFYKDGS